MDLENDSPAADAEVEEVEAEELDADLPEDTDWKAEAIKARRMASRYRNQAIKAKETKVEKPQQESKPQETAQPGLGYEIKAFLVANGVKGKQAFEFAENWMKRTGDDPETMLEDEVFQAKLKSFLDTQAAKAATPATRRAGTVATDTVEYWIAKGELPPASNRELRSKVLAAKRAKSSGHFYNS